MITKSLKNKIEKEVDTNYSYFDKHKQDLLRNHRGEFVVIRNKEFIEFFKSWKDACEYGEKQYKDKIFSVQEIIDKIKYRHY